jgi:hypothetical protein
MKDDLDIPIAPPINDNDNLKNNLTNDSNIMEENEILPKTIVLDNGSSTIRAGFSGKIFKIIKLFFD